MEDPQFNFSKLCRIVRDLDVDVAFDLTGIVDDVTGDAVRCSGMVEERIDIVATVSNHILALFQLKDQP